MPTLNRPAMVIAKLRQPRVHPTERRSLHRARRQAHSRGSLLESSRGRINVSCLSDVEVMEYVDFSKQLAETSKELGVNRQGPATTWDVLATIDLIQLASRILFNARLILRAKSIQGRI